MKQMLLIFPIYNWEGYGASRDGTIWSKRKTGYDKKLRDHWRPLKPDIRKDGYHQVGLYKNSKLFQRMIHRLITDVFIGSCPDGMEVAHNNGVRGDNRIENLRYATRKDNQSDKYLHGTDFSGERNGRAKLTEKDVYMIRKRYATGDIFQSVLAFEYNVDRTTISDIVKGKTWTHINDKKIELELDQLEKELLS